MIYHLYTEKVKIAHHDAFVTMRRYRKLCLVQNVSLKSKKFVYIK